MIINSVLSGLSFNIFVNNKKLREICWWKCYVYNWVSLA